MEAFSEDLSIFLIVGILRKGVLCLDIQSGILSSRENRLLNTEFWNFIPRISVAFDVPSKTFPIKFSVPLVPKTNSLFTNRYLRFRGWLACLGSCPWSKESFLPKSKIYLRQTKIFEKEKNEETLNIV